jgi:uncharacterized protein (TIGR03382 family)
MHSTSSAVRRSSGGGAGVLFGLVLAASALAACAAPEDDVVGDDGSLRGELAVYVSNNRDGRSETSYFLRDAMGGELKLLFGSPPDLAPSAPIKVWGTPIDGALQVSSYHKVDRVDATRSALINATPFAARSFAFVLVDVGAGVNETETAIMGRLIDEPASVRNYYLKASYGMQDITAQVFGPISYAMSGCDTGALARTLRPMIPGTFQHYLWYFGSQVSDCSWSGLASVGTPQTPSRDTWYNDRTGCVVLVQEPGHNFGMQHSSSLRCTGASFADDPNSCTSSEYGDPFDPMGGGCRHMNAWQKSFQGWLGGCNGVRVTNSGTFTLLPYELACDGTQFLQVKAIRPRMFDRAAAGGGGDSVENLDFYYLELRTPVDFDGTTGNRNALAPMVLVHAAAELRPRTMRGLHTFLLDMTPSTTGNNGFGDAGLLAGQTFTDPAGGLSITAQSVSAAGATIVVTYTAGSGAPTCMDGTGFTAPGPGTESCSTPVPTGAGGTTGGGGTTGSGTGTAGDGQGGATNPVGSAGTNGGQAGTGPGAISGGCACDTGGSGVPSSMAVLLFAGLAAAFSRRRASRVRVRSPR